MRYFEIFVLEKPWKMSSLTLFEEESEKTKKASKKQIYKINFERSVSLTRVSKFLLIYSLLITIFSPERSVAVKLISSKIFSIIVCNLLAPIFSTVVFTSEAMFAIVSIPSSENSSSTFSVLRRAIYLEGKIGYTIRCFV